MNKVILSATIMMMFLAVARQATATKQCPEAWEEFGQACSNILADLKTRSAKETFGSQLAWFKSPADHLYFYRMANRLFTVVKLIYVIMSSTLILLLLSHIMQRAYSVCPRAPVTPPPSDRTLAKLERIKRNGMQDALKNGQKPLTCTHLFPGATGDDANGTLYATHRKDIACKCCNSKKALALCKKLA